MRNLTGNLPEQSRYDFNGLSGVRENLFPYCLEEQADGRWKLLNRNYMPIGCKTRSASGLETVQLTFRLKGFGAKTRKKLCAHNGSIQGRIYLYRESCAPDVAPHHMRAYLDKLAALIPLDTREVMP